MPLCLVAGRKVERHTRQQQGQQRSSNEAEFSSSRISYLRFRRSAWDAQDTTEGPKTIITKEQALHKAEQQFSRLKDLVEQTIECGPLFYFWIDVMLVSLSMYHLVSV